MWKGKGVQPDDLVWVKFYKDKYLHDCNGKINPRVDGLFNVLKRINDNTYKINFPNDYIVHNISTKVIYLLAL